MRASRSQACDFSCRATRGGTARGRRTARPRPRVRILVTSFLSSDKNRPRRFQGDAAKAGLRDGLAAFGRVDVLVTHGPPGGVLDGGAGSGAIAAAVAEHAPRYHIFGHRHDCYGSVVLPPTVFVNASNTDIYFSLVKPAVVIDVVPAAPAVARSDRFAVDLLRKKLRAERGGGGAALLQIGTT